MKRFIIILTFFVISFSIKAQLPSNCNVPDILRNNYDLDVANLTLARLHEIHSPDTSLIEIPQWDQEPIWEGLAAIFNRHDILEVDSVFNKYCVHNAVTHSWTLKSISLNVDTSFSWTRNWAQHQIITGVPTLDSLLAKYGFFMWFYYPAGLNSAFVGLKTNQSINVLPLCDSLESFPGIISARRTGYLGDGSWITYMDSSGLRFYTFTLKWGDCPAGCSRFHTWKFMVYPDCSIDFLGIVNDIDGSNYPEPENCNLSNGIPWQSNIQSNIIIFPNPTVDYLTIKTNLQNTLSLILVDELGRKLLSESFRKETTLDLRSLNQGLYFLIIQNNTHSVATKKILIKRK